MSRLEDKIAFITGNAGIFGEVADVVDYPEDVFERVLAVNVRVRSTSPSMR